MRIMRHRIFMGFVMMAVSVLAIFTAAPAMAQSGGVPDINSLTAATPDSDWSMRMWRSLLGSFADNPFTLGSPTTLLGNMFLVFNACVFVVGFTWAMYGVISGLVATAHEGEVLGRRMSSVWFPIRMIMGIAGMVPIFGGFTLNQAIMMFLTTVGIGIGNTIWTQAVNSTDQFQALMADKTMSPASANQVRQIATTMFMSHVCMDLENRAIRINQAHGAGEPLLERTQAQNGATTSIKYGNTVNHIRCGEITITNSARNSDISSFSDLFSGYRVESVNYSAIRNAVLQTYRSGLTTMETRLQQEAVAWIAARQAALDAGAEVPPVPLPAIEAAVAQLIDTVTNSPVSSDTSMLSANAKHNMLALGWFGAGAWFATLAEANATIADARVGPTMTSEPPAQKQLSQETMAGVNAASASMMDSLGSQGRGNSAGDSASALVDSAIRDAGGSFLGMSCGTATGNCSLGQAVVSAGIRGLAVGSGGGGNAGGGNPGLDSSGFVNPIIMMKNMGDYVMGFSSTLLTAGMVGSAVGYIVENTPLGRIASVASVASKLGKKTPGGDEGGGAFSGILAVMKTLAMVFLVLGAAMAIYIPLIPFITWMGAVLAYAASVLEGLAGSTLHAMSHLDGDGDGLGQRTAHGYLFMINVLARPALMLVGFLVASALMIAIGTLQAIMFLPAMANVQGNSVTGVFSVVMFLVVFFVMNLTLIQASFNLIYVITDQVIGFVGNAINSTLGRETEDKVNNLFLMAARVGPGAIGSAGAARRAAKEASSAAAGGKAGLATAAGGGGSRAAADAQRGPK